MKTLWSPNSWRSKPAKHMPIYKDENSLKECLDKIKKFPPLVFAGEARSLKSKLAKVSTGEAFLLQGCPFFLLLNFFHGHPILLLGILVQLYRLTHI